MFLFERSQTLPVPGGVAVRSSACFALPTLHRDIQVSLHLGKKLRLALQVFEASAFVPQPWIGMRSAWL